MTIAESFSTKFDKMNHLACMNYQVQVVSFNDTPIFTGIPEYGPDGETDCWIIAGRKVYILDIHKVSGAKVILAEESYDFTLQRI